MEEKYTAFDSAVVNYANGVIRWRWLVVLVCLVFTMALGYGAQGLWINTNYRAFFSEDNPQLTAFESLQDIYTKNTKNDNILFVLAPKKGEVFTNGTLAVAEELTAESWMIPHAIRVDAVTNFQHTRAEEDDLIVDDLVSNAMARTREELVEARAVALAEPLLRNRLISERTHVTGVNATIHLPGKSDQEVPEAVAKAREMAAAIRADHSELDVYLTGTVMLNNAFSEAATGDMKTLIPLMYLGMFLVMIILLRDISSTISTILVVTFSTVAALGIAGWFKIGLTPPSAQAPTMIMTLAIADSIHILITLLREMRDGRSKREAIVESLRINMQPVFLTSLTTAIGFLSMNYSDAPPFHHLGNTTAAGVTLAFLFSVSLLPALVAILPVRAPRKTASAEGTLERFADYVIARRQGLFWVSGLVIIGVAGFLFSNQLNDQFVEYFDESVQFRNDTDFAVDNLSGIYLAEFSLGAGESGGISNPEYLAKLEEFTEWYRQQPHVLHVNSFSEVMKRLNKNMHGDDPAYYKVPDRRDLAAQYLLLYEMSLPYGLDLNNQINVDKSATRFSVTMADISSRDIRSLASGGDDWLRDNAPEHMQATGAGPAVMFSHISERNIKSMLTGTLIAVVLISIALCFALRSLHYGALSLIPNLFPGAMAFGVWGLIDGQINMALSLVTGMTLGIVVDDTVHFLSKYLRARREQNLDSPAAVRYAFSTVGLALVTTSIILVIGFGVLSLSPFLMNSSMGQLTAITIALALAVDFFFLPPLLMRVDRGKKEDAEPLTVGDPELAGAR